MLRHAELIASMTLEEKIRLCSGASFWTTEAMPHHGIPSLFLSDGPHGLRKQAGTGDRLGSNERTPATCFPTASAVAATWDLDLIREMGEALGAEAVKQLKDGAWNCETPPSKRSSFHTTICVLEGLLEYEKAKGPRRP